MPADVSAIVLAAGGGTRMRSELPKVLHPAAGRPLLVHVLEALAPLDLQRTLLVVGRHHAVIEQTAARYGFGDVAYALQDPPSGTADAVRAGLEAFGDGSETVVVLNGDSPLVTTETIAALLEVHAETAAAGTLLTARVRDPAGFGRVIRNGRGDIERVVEEKDATLDEKGEEEVNAGAYVFDAEKLGRVLGKVDRENAQHEYLITDVVGLFRSQGETISAHRTHELEVLGVNSRAQLARVSGLLRRRTCERWMDEGVTIIDPDTTYIDASVRIEKDATIHPFTFLEGDTVVGREAEIGPQARIVDSDVGSGATVSFAVVRGSEIGAGASVGPFASLRAGTKLGRGARLGTFVESKKATLGAGSKANHLAYLGDAEIGDGVNVGAGTITCNWDGRDKHTTVIEDDAYIGSDTMLVAPVHVGKRGATGAGSVVRGEVPDDALAVGVPARIIEGRGNKMGREARKSAPEPRE